MILASTFHRVAAPYSWLEILVFQGKRVLRYKNKLTELLVNFGG